MRVGVEEKCQRAAGEEEKPAGAEPPGPQPREGVSGELLLSDEECVLYLRREAPLRSLLSGQRIFRQPEVS